MLQLLKCTKTEYLESLQFHLRREKKRSSFRRESSPLDWVKTRKLFTFCNTSETRHIALESPITGGSEGTKSRNPSWTRSKELEKGESEISSLTLVLLKRSKTRAQMR